MELSSEDWQRIDSCLIRLYKELDSVRHARLMLELLNELVPVDNAALNFYRPPGQFTAVMLPEDAATEEQVALVGRYFHQSPFAYYRATQDASWKRVRDFMPGEDFYKLDLHRLALGPLGVNYQLGGLLIHINDTAYIITLHRTHREFTERERKIVNVLHPHLVSSYVNAIVCTGARKVVSQKGVREPAPLVPPPRRFRPLPRLTQRQNEVLQWMVEGKRNAEIARILSISPRTVEKHVAEILAILKVENRATAILAAMEFSAKANEA
ncbi:MAG TPA: helix-turn-helix transcriptional regulator [Candidatus Sulfotelmatobacter sp.]|nr:helix-turn-helix transcriptional regulator [Candidatus Sulfotelmatobacter sp.]